MKTLKIKLSEGLFARMEEVAKTRSMPVEMYAALSLLFNTPYENREILQLKERIRELEAGTGKSE